MFGGTQTCGGFVYLLGGSISHQRFGSEVRRKILGPAAAAAVSRERKKRTVSRGC